MIYFLAALILTVFGAYLDIRRIDRRRDKGLDRRRGRMW